MSVISFMRSALFLPVSTMGMTGWEVVSVFDVSQTEGREIPDIAVDELTGSVERYQDFFTALERTSPVPIAFENIESGAHGYYHLALAVARMVSREAFSSDSSLPLLQPAT